MSESVTIHVGQGVYIDVDANDLRAANWVPASEARGLGSATYLEEAAFAALADDVLRPSRNTTEGASQ